MRNAWIWIVVIVVIVVGGFIWWQSSQSGSTNQAPTDQTTTDTTQVPTDTTASSTDTTASPSGTDTTGGAATGSTVTITYDGNSFSPATVTIKKGQTVNWVDSSGTMWIASSPHPAHTGYDGTSRSTHCAPGYSGATPF